MAEDDILDLGNIDFTSGIADLGNIALWVLIGALIIGIFYFVYYISSFKHTLIVRDIVNGRKLIRRFKWREHKDKKKNIWLQTPFNKIKKPLPPNRSVEVTPKGKKWVEAWRGEDTETLVYINDRFDYDQYKDENESFQPVTTQERELIVTELSKAAAYKKKTTAELILQISLIMAPILLIAIIGIVLGDITEALVTYSQPLTDTLTTVSDNFVTASNNLAGIQEVTQEVEVPN